MCLSKKPWKLLKYANRNLGLALDLFFSFLIHQFLLFWTLQKYFKVNKIVPLRSHAFAPLHFALGLVSTYLYNSSAVIKKSLWLSHIISVQVDKMLLSMDQDANKYQYTSKIPIYRQKHINIKNKKEKVGAQDIVHQRVQYRI